MTTITAQDVKPGMTLRYMHSSPTFTKPAKYATVVVKRVEYNGKYAGSKTYLVVGTSTPEWGGGKYKPSYYNNSLNAAYEFELVSNPEPEAKRVVTFDANGQPLVDGQPYDQWLLRGI